jgi:predicted secreted protein
VKTWRLRARARGRTRVELKRWRHWEGDQSIVERFGITLDIKPG